MGTAIIVAFIFIILGIKSFGKGVVLGTIFSIINFIIMGETLALKINKTKGKLFLLSLGSILFRYMLLSIPLIAAIKFEQFNVFAAVCGIFMVQIMIMVDPLWNRISLLFEKKV